MKLEVSHELSFPLEAVTETFGILAVRGAGKSNTAAVMAEEMFRAKLPFVAIDPVRAWWGLRSSRSGKGPGLAIPIFGGRHGDVPLERTSGQLIAQLIVKERLSCVLDVSEWDSEAAKKQFLLDFARELYQRNEEPLHLFLEEADDYIPQRPMRDEAQLLRAWENIIRRGRNRGIGCTLITQRSAAINKNVLTQVQTLIPMRTTGPQDIKAIREWVQFHRQSEKLLESLPGLADGEAWVWSPHFLRTLKRVRFRLRHTYDSGATPKISSGHRSASTLADVDLDVIKKQMAATIEKAKTEDPKELRRTISELRAQLAKKDAVLSEVDARTKKIDKTLDRVKRVKVPILKDRQIRRLERIVIRVEKSGALVATLKRAADAVAEAIRSPLLAQAAAKVPPAPQCGILGCKNPPEMIGGIMTAFCRKHVPKPLAKPREYYDGKGTVTTLPSKRDPRHRILNALAWWEAAGVEQPTRHQAAFVAGYTVNGHFNNMIGSLRTEGLVDYPGGGALALTEAGRRQAQPLDAEPSRDVLIQRVLSVLRGEPTRRIFTVLVDKSPITREELARMSGYTVNGHFNNMVGTLRSLGVAKYPGDGTVALSDLFDMR